MWSDILNITLSNIIIAMLLVLVATLLVVYFQKRRAIKELNKKNDLIKKQSRDIAKKNRELESKNKELEDLNVEKNNIIGVVSHDLKAPLNRIFALSNLLMLSGENLSDPQKEYIDKMNYVVKDGLDLVRNLLDIRAIEYKAIRLNLEWLDIKLVLDKLIKSYDTSVKKKGQRLFMVKPEIDTRIFSDRQYLSRIFDNLLSNATKFSDEGTTVKIVVDQVDRYLRVKVIDEGPGISEDDQKRLFQKFQVLSTKPTSGEISTGLGLSIVKSLVKILEGKVFCESKLGEGSTFIVELPYKVSVSSSK